MRQYKTADVARMAVNPLENVHKDNPQWKHLFPDVAQFKYLAWAYDPYSPLVRTYHDPEERKKYAAQLSGCSKLPTPEDVFNYCSIVSNPVVWQAIVTLEETIREFNLRARRPIDYGDGEEEESSEGMEEERTEPTKKFSVSDEEKVMRMISMKFKFIESIKKMLKELAELYLIMYAGDLKSIEEAGNTLQRSTPESRMRKAP